MNYNNFGFTFQFKDRLNDFSTWRTISDDLFMEKLYKYTHKMTPLIKRMLQGEVLAYPEGEYRIRAIDNTTKL